MKQLFLSPEGCTFQTFNLEGTEIEIRLYYNQRTENFYVDIFDIQGNEILSGVLIEQRKTIYSRHKAFTGLKGNMLFISLSGVVSENTILSGDASIIYYLENETENETESDLYTIKKVSGAILAPA
jgi:hypothetical protein